jgi:hypothetical protein
LTYSSSLFKVFLGILFKQSTLALRSLQVPRSFYPIYTRQFLAIAINIKLIPYLASNANQ